MNKCLVTVMSIAAAMLSLIDGQARTCRPAATGSLTIIVEPVYNNQPLKLGSQPYVNEHGDTLYVDLFKFYITNLRLQGSEVTVADGNSHLVDADNDATLSFTIQHIPPGGYSALQLVLGVDSMANTAGANAGDLDPAKGMYWAWNSGYIMTKVEGHSRVCKTFHHGFEFHIGGYMPPYNAARAVKVALPHSMNVKEGVHRVIRLKADVAAWFSGGLDLAKVNSIMIPGKDAALMADRYSSMFSIVADAE